MSDSGSGPALSLSLSRVRARRRRRRPDGGPPPLPAWFVGLHLAGAAIWLIGEPNWIGRIAPGAVVVVAGALAWHGWPWWRDRVQAPPLVDRHLRHNPLLRSIVPWTCFAWSQLLLAWPAESRAGLAAIGIVLVHTALIGLSIRATVFGLRTRR